MLEIDSIIQEQGLEFSNGEHIDSFFVCLLLNILDIPRRFYTASEMVTKNPYLWQTLANSASSVYELPGEGILLAEYGPDTNTPFYRLYCYRYMENNAVAKEALATQVSCKIKTISISGMHDKYNDYRHTEKVKRWVANLESALYPTTMVAEGRLENTTVEKNYSLQTNCRMCSLRKEGDKFCSLYCWCWGIYSLYC